MDDAVGAYGSQASAIRGKNYKTGTLLVTWEALQLLSGCGLAQAKFVAASVLSSDGQQPAVRRKGPGDPPGLEPLNAAQLLPRGCLPEADSAVAVGPFRDHFTVCRQGNGDVLVLIPGEAVSFLRGGYVPD